MQYLNKIFINNYLNNKQPTKISRSQVKSYVRDRKILTTSKDYLSCRQYFNLRKNTRINSLASIKAFLNKSYTLTPSLPRPQYDNKKLGTHIGALFESSGMAKTIPPEDEHLPSRGPRREFPVLSPRSSGGHFLCS